MRKRQRQTEKPYRQGKKKERNRKENFIRQTDRRNWQTGSKAQEEDWLQPAVCPVSSAGGIKHLLEEQLTGGAADWLLPPILFPVREGRGDWWWCDGEGLGGLVRGDGVGLIGGTGDDVRGAL